MVARTASSLTAGGLPNLDLPKYLTETRWGRCAHIKEGVQSDLPSVPWHWASTVHIAVPPGIVVFKTSLEYAHGGLRLQECLVPETTISSTAPVTADVAITSVQMDQSPQPHPGQRIGGGLLAASDVVANLSAIADTAALPEVEFGGDSLPRHPRTPTA